MRESTQIPSRHRFRLDVGVSLGLCLTGLAFAAFGLFRYGVWMNRGPGPGFFPVVAGLLTAVPAAVALFGKIRDDAEAFRWRSAVPAIAVIVSVLLVPVFGMVEAMSLFILAWVRFVERRSWRDALVSSIAGFVVAHLIFSIWLSVFFPDSLVPSVLNLWS